MGVPFAELTVAVNMIVPPNFTGAGPPGIVVALSVTTVVVSARTIGVFVGVSVAVAVAVGV